MSEDAPDLSIVVPLKDEEESVSLLHAEISRAAKSVNRSYEIVFVDDGSRDGSYERLRAIRSADPRVKLIRLTRNFGQTAALQAGIDHASGRVLVTMDADLQNDPDDIHSLLAAIDSGSDLVCGWRRERQDRLWTRRVPSVVANWLIGRLTGVRIHDNGCSLRAYRTEVVRRARLYGEMHRFLAPMLTLSGCRVEEIVVHHRPRRFGRSKYGLARIWKVFLDLLTLRMIVGFSARPGLWFALCGIPFLLLGSGFLAATLRTLSSAEPEPAQILMLSTATMLAAIAFTHLLLMGMLSELVLRTGAYREARTILARSEEPS